VLLKQDKHAVMNRSREITSGRYNQRSARNRLARFWLFPTEDWVDQAFETSRQREMVRRRNREVPRLNMAMVGMKASSFSSNGLLLCDRKSLTALLHCKNHNH
jgi:hypothetical protein